MQKDRELGYWETIKALTHDNFGGSDIVVVELFLQGDLKVDLLKQAFAFAFKHHTMLSTTVQLEGDVYRFNVIKYMNLFRSVLCDIGQ